MATRKVENVRQSRNSGTGLKKLGNASRTTPTLNDDSASIRRVIVAISDKSFASLDDRELSPRFLFSENGLAFER